MRRRLIALLVLVSLIVSVVDFFSSQWVFKRGFASYAAESRRDQVRDWAVLLGLLYADHGNSWVFLRSATKPLGASLALPTDGLLYTSIRFVVRVDGRVIFVHGASVSLRGPWEAAPIVVRGRQVGELQVQRFTPIRLQTLQNRIESSSMALLLLILLIVALSATVVGVIFLRRFLKPLAQLSRAVRDIRNREYEVTWPTVTDREVRDVALAIESVRTELVKARTAREKLLADLHHELRTPMTIIATRLEAIQCGLYPFDEHSATILYEEIMRMGNLLADLRQLNDAQAGELLLKLEIVDVRPWIEGIVERFRVELDTKRIDVETTVSPAELQVHMDALRMTQVLLNLLSNALRLIPSDSRIALSARLMEETAEVVFTVCDEGPGIAAEHLPHVLERFYRADPSRQRDTGGTGLGLAIVAEIAHAHGGRVNVENQVGRGVCVQVTLPRRSHDPATPS